MSSNEWLIDATTRHQVFLQRYAGGQAKVARSALLRLRRDINARISQEGDVIQRNRLAVLLADIDTLAARTYGDITAKTVAGSRELAMSEAEFSQMIFNKSTSSAANFTLPGEAALILAVDSTALGVGKRANETIASTLKSFDIAKRAELEQVILDSVVTGANNKETAAKVADIIGTKQMREAETIVRTVTNSVSNIARDQTMEANRDIADQYRWVSTLDSRTTFICAGRDNKEFDIGQGPLPPAHFACRSTIVLIVKPEFNLGRGAKGTRTARGETGKTSRVDSKKAYGGWLKDQPVEFIDEALGPKRAALFKSGKIKIDKFTDPTGRVYTLKELEGMIKISMQ